MTNLIRSSEARKLEWRTLLSYHFLPISRTKPHLYSLWDQSFLQDGKLFKFLLALDRDSKFWQLCVCLQAAHIFLLKGVKILIYYMSSLFNYIVWKSFTNINIHFTKYFFILHPRHHRIFIELHSPFIFTLTKLFLLK